MAPKKPPVPVPECVGAQVGILAVLELSLDELVQGFLEQGLVLGVHVLDALQPERSSLGSGSARKEDQQRPKKYTTPEFGIGKLQQLIPVVLSAISAFSVKPQS